MENDDLIPIFLAEARERLEGLKEHLEAIDRSPGAREEVRRQLHGLKGAARMLGLTELASLCHRGEDLFSGSEEIGQTEADRILRGIEMAIDDLEKRSRSAGGGKPDSPAGRERPVGERGGVVGVPSRILDEATDRATRLRHLTSAESSAIEELFELSRFAEAGVADREPRQVLATLAISLRQVAMELDRTHRPVLELVRQHQEDLVRVHRQPLSPYLRRMARHAEELASTLGKTVSVSVDCDRVTLDRRLMATLEEPILHLVRNALDHGLESPEERRALGKGLPGILEIGGRGEGAMIHVWIRDDGRGIDRQRILRRARELGLLKDGEDAPVPEQELLNLLFRPGFSTARKLTEISGRGIGLDAVAATVHRMGGRLRMESEPGRGTAVHLLVPAVRRGEHVLVLAAAGLHAAVPSAHVLRFLHLDGVRIAAKDGVETATVDGRRVRLQRLERLFGEPPGEGEAILVLLSAGESEIGLVVDRTVGEEDVVLQPFPAVAGSHPAFESVAVLSGGLPVPVVSPRLLAALQADELPELLQGRTSRRLRVLVADDSRVTREMLRRVLEDGGCTVLTVASGEEAFGRLQDRSWDCLVTDVEMPGMDGLQLTRRIRATTGLRNLPIVVVSTRGLEDDRLAGLEAGADAYLTKQGLSPRELIGLVRRLGGSS